MEFKEIISLALFLGTALGAVLIALRQSTVAKSVQNVSAQVRGVVVPLETIERNLGTVVSDVQVIKNDLATVKEDQKETKAEVRKAVNDRQQIMTDIAALKGAEQGRREVLDRLTEQDRDRKGRR